MAGSVRRYPNSTSGFRRVGYVLADGLSYAEVAKRLVLSERTVGHHVSAVLRKLGEPSRSGAVAAALRKGILPST
jgi:DNA-binding NarL/FixJ family response regulator